MFQHHITKTNLSEAWLEVLRQITQEGVTEISPLMVTITGFNNGIVEENSVIQKELEAFLPTKKFPRYQTVASTIFPRSLWNKEKTRQTLFDRYTRILPKIRKCPRNRYGVYFERLIAFGEKESTPKINQLEHIIQTYTNGNHRHSALQVSIFNPYCDHTNQRQRGFPCLQQVSFAVEKQKELTVTGFYATQHVVERAYGNYLGLYYLGEFMAHEMGLELKTVNCMSSVVKLDINKTEAKSLIQKCSGQINLKIGEANTDETR